MQDYVELEGGVDVTSVAPAEGQSLERWLLAGAGTFIVSLLGYVYKNRRSGQSLEDATNEVTVVTIRNQQLRITELEERNRALLVEVLQTNQTMLEAQRGANNAAIQADNAQAAAAQASAAAIAARGEADALRQRVLQQAAYIRTLRSFILEANLQPPEEPA